ncbi:MAG: VC0807 family protein [Candidatus Binatus sp.]
MTTRSPSAPAPAQRFNRREARKSLALSLTINALCPFLLYRALQSRFPADSVMPLLYATIFPVIGLILSLVRKRTVDAIAIITMAGLSIHIVVTLLARTVRIALVVRSLDGALIGLALIISALIGRPIILLVAKQVVAGGSSDQAASLNRLIENGGASRFFTITLVWGICLMAMSGLHVVLALELPPAEFLLVSPVVGVATILALLVWTGRYLAVRRRP